MQPLIFRSATVADVPALTALVRIAYRGDESRTGWTTEADLLADERIDVDGVRRKITDPGSAVLIADLASGNGSDAAMIACCELVERGDGVAYFGMFAVRPGQQDSGIGRAVLAEAERRARAASCTAMEMTVIAQRSELIAWYVRRGYVLTDERRPFPYEHLVNGRALRDDLYFVVLRKDLA